MFMKTVLQHHALRIFDVDPLLGRMFSVPVHEQEYFPVSCSFSNTFFLCAMNLLYWVSWSSVLWEKITSLHKYMIFIDTWLVDRIAAMRKWNLWFFYFLFINIWKEDFFRAFVAPFVSDFRFIHFWGWLLVIPTTWCTLG